MKPEDFVESLLANGCCHDLYFITDEKFQKSRFFSLHGNSTFPQVSLYACFEKLFSNMKLLSQNTWGDETEKWKENREYKSLKNSVGKLSHWIQLLS